jgi:hypothetical protein
MPDHVEIERALASISATLNDQQLESFDRDRVQEIATGALGGEQHLEVDDAGGVHAEDGVRVGAIRRTSSGEWIVEHQNPDAHRSDVAVPAPPKQRFLRKAFTRLKAFGS